MLKELSRHNKGQSLIEILIAIGVGVIIIGGVAATIGVTLRSNVSTKNSQTATALGQEVINELTDFTAGNWHNLDSLAAGVQYRIATTGPAFTAQAGPETFTLDGKEFTRYFTYENVSRDVNNGNDIDPSASYNPVNDDPSTKKINVVVSWLENSSPANVTLNKFVTRSKNQVLLQTDWSGGGAQVTFPNGGTTVNNKYDTKGSNLKTSNPGYLRTLVP